VKLITHLCLVPWLRMSGAINCFSIRLNGVHKDNFISAYKSVFDLCSPRTLTPIRRYEGYMQMSCDTHSRLLSCFESPYLCFFALAMLRKACRAATYQQTCVCVCVCERECQGCQHLCHCVTVCVGYRIVLHLNVKISFSSYSSFYSLPFSYSPSSPAYSYHSLNSPPFTSCAKISFSS
jgi:hypothetical protein